MTKNFDVVKLKTAFRQGTEAAKEFVGDVNGWDVVIRGELLSCQAAVLRRYMEEKGARTVAFLSDAEASFPQALKN
jgi:hypothetical protein